VIREQSHAHHYFFELPHLLQAGDLLVLNNTRVIPARLYGYKLSGAKVEVLLLEQRDPLTWLALVKPGRRIHVEDHLIFSEKLSATVIAREEKSGGRLLCFHWPKDLSFEDLLTEVGHIPFPPYIRNRDVTEQDYQTLWATHPGSVAAPTAGLHFTPSLLASLADRGIQTTDITLHIGLDTFRPVEVEDVTQHHLHKEWLRVSAETVTQIAQTQAQGGRIIAVGTTVVRALETAAQSGILHPWEGKSDLFIYPGYRWQVIDGLITNFHLPCSSLLMLVSALVGRERLLALYAEAIQARYRFFSFGDAMVIID
jgi:S-adenosylmethionine:tRNA ribosyltransferase-isomerase